MTGEPAPEAGVGKALVPIDPTVCPRCAGPTVEETSVQLPLLRHGGYGAAGSMTQRRCPACWWGVILDETETNPRAVAS